MDDAFRDNSDYTPSPSLPLPLSPSDTPMARPESIDQSEFTLDLVNAIETLLALKRDSLSTPAFSLEVTPQSADFNLELLKKYKWDLSTLYNSDAKIVTWFGSEFKDVNNLRILLGKKHRWKKFESQQTKGIYFELEELTNKMRRLNLIEAAKRGNHKSAELKNDFVRKVLEKEIQTDCL